jgi:large conductance mechanosensitive channel
MKLWDEFKAFAFKGNMIDLAVAVVIGAAFGAVISSLVKNVIMPALSYVQPQQAGYTAWKIGRIEIGIFIGEVINFIVIALAVFLCIVKVMGMIQKLTAPPAPSEPVTKECPYCLSVIPIKATKCAHCTSDLPAAG